MAVLLVGVGNAAPGRLLPDRALPGPKPPRPSAAGEREGNAASRERAGSVKLRLLGVNDLHGHLEPSLARRPRRAGGRRVPVGGAALLGAYFDRASLPGRTIRVHAGDMIGASPLVSSHFHDEPSIEAMNLMRFDVGTLGNHEFDEGPREVLRLLRGGRRRGRQALKRDERGRRVNTSRPGFEGVDFPYVAANAVDRHGRLLLPPYAIVRRAGVRVGFIGVATTSAPTYLLARHRSRVRFLDPARSVNRYARKLRAQGVRAIVVLAHAGAHQHGATAHGEIVDEVRAMSRDVDVVVAGHTHTRLNLRVPNRSGGGSKLVVQSRSFGTAYDQVDLRVDRASGEVVAKSARVPRTWAGDLKPERSLQRLVTRYARRVARLSRRVVGVADRSLARTDLGTEDPSSGLGKLVADAQRELAGADAALVNPGNMRADLDRGAVRYADLFAVAPYEHDVMRLELRGADIVRVLEEQYTSEPAVRLHVSGLRWRRLGDRVVDVVVGDGRRLEPRRRYTVAANELLVGTAQFGVLARRGRAMHAVGTDLEALVRHVSHAKDPLG